MNLHFKNIIVAGTSTIPFGGGISVLIDKYIPDNLQKKRDKLLEDILIDLENIKEEINEDFFKSEDFTIVFLRIFNKAMIENNQIKSKIFRSILKNIALQNYKIDLETEIYIKLIEDLVTHQLEFLRHINNGENIYEKVSYFTDLIEHRKYSLTGLENYGLIEKVDSQYNYIKYKLTKLGERFYSFIDFENIYKELIDELQQFKK